MKKRVLAGILMMIMVFASVMGVSAANSKTDDVYVPEEVEQGYYKVVKGTEEFADLKASQYAEVFKEIESFNKGTITSDKMLEDASKDVKDAVKGKSVIGKVFDLVKVNNGQPENGKHIVTIAVPSLTTKMTNIKVLHFSEVIGAWEVVPSEVDYTNKTVTVTLTNFSPVAIYAEGVSGGAAGTSPSTGVTSSTWMIWTAAALIVLGTGVVVAQKKRF